MNLNNDKIYTQKHFVADVGQKSEYIENLLNYVFIFQEIEVGIYKNEKKSQRLEERAISLLLEELGYNIKKTSKKALDSKDKLKTQLHKVKIASRSGVQSAHTIYGLNRFSNTRRRKSIILDNPTERNSFMLLVIGEEKAMRHILKFTRKESNVYKIMIAKLKQQGLKIQIVAKKILTTEEVYEYVKSYKKISLSSRDQIEDLERLALEME